MATLDTHAIARTLIDVGADPLSLKSIRLGGVA